MIISDSKKFVFVHIPKCAGTSVRSLLQMYDSTNGFFSLRVEPHQYFEMLDYQHIPLFILKKYFPIEYKKIEEYWSFSIVRDPYQRFQSSFSQRTKMYKGTLIHELTYKEIKTELDKTIDYLLKTTKKNTLLDASYIHFQKQIDYIYLNDKKIIDSVFCIDSLDILFRELSQKFNINEEIKEIKNQTIIFRNNYLKFLIERGRPIINLVAKNFSEDIKEKIRSKVYIPRNNKSIKIFESNYIRNFIDEYYKDDFILLNAFIK